MKFFTWRKENSSKLRVLQKQLRELEITDQNQESEIKKEKEIEIESELAVKRNLQGVIEDSNKKIGFCDTENDFCEVASDIPKPTRLTGFVSPDEVSNDFKYKRRVSIDVYEVHRIHYELITRDSEREYIEVSLE